MHYGYRSWIAFFHLSGEKLGTYFHIEARRLKLSEICNLDNKDPVEVWELEEWKLFYRRVEPTIRFFIPEFRKLLQRNKISTTEILESIFEHFLNLRMAGAKYLVFGDEGYPYALRYIEKPPLGLTVLGSPEKMRGPSVSVVGARQASIKALKEAYELGKALSKSSISCVSGGAYGCDIAAHQGMIDAGCSIAKAITVFAGGLGRLGPRGNLSTFRSVLHSGGCLVSENSWFHHPYPKSFCRRNRIISGLSMDVFVMQAGARSGTLVTARLALEQGREVYVYYPQERVMGFEGSQSLIEDGAYSFSSVEELIQSGLFESVESLPLAGFSL